MFDWNSLHSWVPIAITMIVWNGWLTFTAIASGNDSEPTPWIVIGAIISALFLAIMEAVIYGQMHPVG